MKSRALASLTLAGTILCLSAPSSFNQTAPPPRRPLYQVTEVGYCPGFSQTALTGVNEEGHVVGFAYPHVPPGHGDFLLGHAIVWNEEKFAALNTQEHAYSHAYGINKEGVIVGDAAARPVLWKEENAAPTALSKQSGYAACINDRGEIVANDGTLFVWKEGKRTELNLPALKTGHYQPVAINNQGDIALYSWEDGVINFDTTPIQAFLWKGGVLTTLPTNGATRSKCTGLNDSGTVVGWIEIPGDKSYGKRRACLWKDGKIQLLETPAFCQSEAAAINRHESIVGYIIDDKNVHHACLWQDGALYDLMDCVPRTAGMKLEEATCINDRGQILVDYKLLSPVSNHPGMDHK